MAAWFIDKVSISAFQTYNAKTRVVHCWKISGCDPSARSIYFPPVIRSLISQLGKRRTFVRSNMVSLAALDLILRRLESRMMRASLVVKIVGVNLDDRAADMTGFRIPSYPIADLEPLSHLRPPIADICSAIPKRTLKSYLLRVKTLDSLLVEVRACRVCADVLPFGPRPVVQISATARILIASQAPGTKVHDSGIPFSDASGDRLREWMGVSDDKFYDARQIAIIPMGLCYPGRLSGGGDAHPRVECAPLWRDRLLAHMPDLRLTLLVGTHAQNGVLGPGKMTDRVMGYWEHLPTIFPLPHPSWRSRHWATKNPWFDADVLPALRSAVQRALS